jgi:hypothetical protein
MISLFRDLRTAGSTRILQGTTWGTTWNDGSTWSAWVAVFWTYVFGINNFFNVGPPVHLGTISAGSGDRLSMGLLWLNVFPHFHHWWISDWTIPWWILFMIFSQNSPSILPRFVVPQWAVHAKLVRSFFALDLSDGGSNYSIHGDYKFINQQT